ncbi:hypothetical protein DMC47_11935 [Nostoc sp. 3335mG]|nr:hypothetical protein DMC47_11935 [Nostoc sp. 3335mG]
MLRLAAAIVIAMLLAGAGVAKEKSRSTTATAPPIATADIVTEGPAGGAYFAPADETTSAALAFHAATGLHAAFVGFGEGNKYILYYALCSGGDCTEDANWQRVPLDLPRGVKAQLALTPEGRPRILAAGWSNEAANGTDYYFAECDTGCLGKENWRMGRVVSTADGLMSNIFRTRLPERSFALDARGNPRFIVADSNYHIEPDHYGGFYMSCDRDCSKARNWTETNLANQSGYSTESFSYPVLALGPDGSAHVIAGVYAFETDGTDLEDGLYYYECPDACEERHNWQRTRVIGQGSGSYPNPTWSMDVTEDGHPRVALFTGYGVDIEGLDQQLLYIYCDADCTAADGVNWFGYPIGVGDGIGESPDIALDSAGVPHIAFTTDSFELGYVYCTNACEVSEDAAWNLDFAERSATAAADRPTALPYTCDGEVWNGMAPRLALVADHPMIAYDLSVEARCLYKEFDKPEITYEFHEIWRGSRVVRPASGG